MSRSFSGWLSDIITAGPSLLVYFADTLPVPLFYFASLASLSLSLSPFLVDTNLSFLLRISSRGIVPFNPHGIAGPTRRDIGSIF